jgi:hypothetical protein
LYHRVTCLSVWNGKPLQLPFYQTRKVFFCHEREFSRENPDPIKANTDFQGAKVKSVTINNDLNWRFSTRR